MKFTVLISLYSQESPFFLNDALLSIWDKQDYKPAQIVLVKDGPLTPELETVLLVWKEKLGDTLTLLSLEKNVGLGVALNIGLQYCSHDLVARMDTDDIAHPERFSRQLAMFKQADIDICSSWITEFDQDENVITGLRKLPEKHNEILEHAKYRCPINHPAVMYKKTVVEKAGGYQAMMWFEDYYLWAEC